MTLNYLPSSAGDIVQCTTKNTTLHSATPHDLLIIHTDLHAYTHPCVGNLKLKYFILSCCYTFTLMLYLPGIPFSLASHLVYLRNSSSFFNKKRKHYLYKPDFFSQTSVNTLRVPKYSSCHMGLWLYTWSHIFPIKWVTLHCILWD
jgi:hypothetical protein